MSQGDTGERGDTGQRGVSGERGPKGDHGQHGDVGLTGDIGERGDTGDKGERGDTGPEGRSTLLSRNIAVSYLLLAVISAVVLGIMTYAIMSNRSLIHRIDAQQEEIQRISRQTHDALCAQRVKDTHDIERSRQYLADVKAGKRKPIIGITEEDILFSIADEQAKVDSLAGLECATS